ncbi:AcaB family transcriptional regulator, partial [Xanthomonas arboricola pv. corylina]|uniref:AcaB family transcriptional regulator n=3 Tax=Xanthomonas arboricola TaxID=56448 RepID=UPI0040407622
PLAWLYVQYRYSGCTRDDFAAKNAAARVAMDKFGELPQDVLEGTRRSKFSPPIARQGLQQRSVISAAAVLPGEEANTDGDQSA